MNLVTVSLLLLAAAGQAAQDPNGSSTPAAPRQPLGFKVFNNMDQPLTGLWDLEIPEMPARRVEIKEAVTGNPNVLVGTDIGTNGGSGEEILRLTRKKEGIGYEGQLSKVLSACGYDLLVISEFLPLGDAAVLRFEMTPPSAPCPAVDSGRAGKLYVFSPKGGPVKLRALADISASNVREAYSIGGDRPNTESSADGPSGGVSVEDGAELKFVRRVKAPLDSSFWFEVETVISPGAGVEPPRGFLKPDTMRFVGSLSLKRVR